MLCLLFQFMWSLSWSLTPGLFFIHISRTSQNPKTMKVICLLPSHSSSYKLHCVHLGELFILKNNSVSWDYRERWRVKKQTVSWRSSSSEGKIEYFITQKILIPPIDTWQQDGRYISSKIQNCDVFEWCLHLNFIFFSWIFVLFHPKLKSSNQSHAFTQTKTKQGQKRK